jgi:hypothetical protein
VRRRFLILAPFARLEDLVQLSSGRGGGPAKPSAHQSQGQDRRAEGLCGEGKPREAGIIHRHRQRLHGREGL